MNGYLTFARHSAQHWSTRVTKTDMTLVLNMLLPTGRIRPLYTSAVVEEVQSIMQDTVRISNPFQRGQDIFPEHMTKSKSEVFVGVSQRKGQGKCYW